MNGTAAALLVITRGPAMRGEPSECRVARSNSITRFRKHSFRMTAVPVLAGAEDGGSYITLRSVFLGNSQRLSSILRDQNNGEPFLLSRSGAHAKDQNFRCLPLALPPRPLAKLALPAQVSSAVVSH